MKRKKVYPFLYLTSTLMLLYTVFDLNASSITFQSNQARSKVYFLLGLILLVLGLYLLNTWRNGIVIVTPLRSMILISLWVMISNLLTYDDLWVLFTHVGLSIWWIVSIVFAFNYFKKHPRSIEQFYFFVSIIFGIYVFNTILAAFSRNQLYDGIVALNIIYRLLVFIPLIYLLKSSKIRNFLLLLIFILVLISFKRGALIIFPSMLISSIIIKNRINGKRSNNLLKSIIFLILIFVSVLIFDYYTNGTILSRFSWEQLKSGSDRDIIYRSAWENIKGRDTLALIIGLGSGSGTGVHNEYLEFLFTFGFIGLLFYFMFLVSILKRFFSLYKQKSIYAVAYGTAVVYIILTSLFSGFYFVHGSVFIVISFGLIESLARSETLESNLIITKRMRVSSE